MSNKRSKQSRLFYKKRKWTRGQLRRSTWRDWLSGDFHAPGYNYLGPGTKDMSLPANSELDYYAKLHDLDYGEIGPSAYTTWNYADDRFMERLEGLLSDPYADPRDKTMADIAYQIFSTKKIVAPKRRHIENREVSTTESSTQVQNGQSESKEETPSQKPKSNSKNEMAYKKSSRRRRRSSNRLRRPIRRRRARRAKRAPMRKKMYRTKRRIMSMPKRIMRSGGNLEKYRIDRGAVTTSAVNECQWSAIIARSEGEISSRLNSLTVYNAATDARVVLANLDDDVNFKAWQECLSTLTLINNQGENDTFAPGNFFPKTNIAVEVYMVLPKYAEVLTGGLPATDTPTKELIDAFVSYGLPANLTGRSHVMSNAYKYFSRFFHVKCCGRFAMNPGEKRIIKFRHRGKFWKRYLKNLLTTDYAKNFNAWWLIRQQGDIGTNPVTDADAAKPFWVQSRLTAMASTYAWMYYKPTVEAIITQSLATSATIDTDGQTLMPNTAVALEVDEEQMGLD